MISNECLYAKGRICISYAECFSSSSLHLCIFSKISYLFYLGSKTISEKNYHFLDLHTLTLSLSLSSNLTLFSNFSICVCDLSLSQARLFSFSPKTSSLLSFSRYEKTFFVQIERKKNFFDTDAAKK